MKKLAYAVLALLIMIVAGSTIGCHHPIDSKARFVSLKPTIASLAPWFGTTTYDAFIFNSFDSGLEKPWQLIGYGQQYQDSLFAFQPLSKPFPVCADRIINTNGKPKDSTSMAISNMATGNLAIDSGLLKAIVKDAGTRANVLLFIPRIEVYKTDTVYYYRHLYYRLYLGFDNGHGEVRIVPHGPLTHATGKVNKDEDQDDYVDLNPCPPAHKDIP